MKQKLRARQLVRDHVRYGKLHKPKRCELCGKLIPRRLLGGHHIDYKYPLIVVWCCIPCHHTVDYKKLHRRKHAGK